MPKYEINGRIFEFSKVPTDEDIDEIASQYPVKDTKVPAESALPDQGGSSLQDMAFGAGETALGMISGTPAFIAGSLGKLGSLAQGGITQEELDKATEDFTPQWTKDITYEPKGIEGKEISEIAGEAFKQVGENLARPASGLMAAFAKSPEDAARVQEKTYNKIAPVTRALFDIGMAGKIGVDLVTPGAAKKPPERKMDSRQAVPEETPSTSKLDAAKAEFKARKAAEVPVNNFAAKRQGFTFNPNSKRMERGSEYIDPLTNQIVDSRKGTQGTTESRVDERFQEPTQVPEDHRLGHQAGEPLITFSDGTTMTRAEWERKGKPNSDGVISEGRSLTTENEFYNLLKEEEQKLGPDVDTSGVRNPYLQGDTKANVEVDSVSGRPVFPEETKVDNTMTRPDGTMRYGLHEKGNDFVTINPDSISKLWLKLSPEKKAEMGLRSAEDLQNFIELHERKHMQDRTNLGDAADKLGREELEKRANNAARDSLAPLLADDSIGPARFPENFKEPYDGPPRMLPEKTRSPAEMRANKESLEKELESVNSKLAEAEQGREHNVGALQRKQAVLESLIEKHADSIEAGRKIGISFQPKKLGGVGKKQGGAVNFGFSEKVVDGIKELVKKAPDVSSFSKFAKELGTDINDPVAKELYEKYYGRTVTELPTPEEAAVSKITGLREIVSPELKTIDEMLPRWEVESDVSGSWKSLRENLSSGGRTVAARTGNSLIDWNVENILGTTKRAQVIIKEAQHDIKGEVNKLTGGLFGKFKGKGEGERVLAEAVSALLKSEGVRELPNISPEAKVLVEKIRTHLDKLGLLIQEELQAQGVTNFQWRPNYLAGVFFGPYRSIVKDSSGKTIGVVAGRTKAEATAAIDYVKTNMPDVTFDVPEYNPKFDKGASNLGARYGKASEVLELLRNQGEAAQTLQTTLSDYYAKAQDNYMGYKQHFKKKEGVFGSEGSRPWENAVENAKDLIEAQLGILDHGYHWLAEQKIAKDMDKILTNSKIGEAQKNSLNYVNMYLDHAFGRMKDEMDFVDTIITKSSELLGIAPSASKEMLAIIRNAALTGTLGLSGAFGLTQFVQVPTTLAIAFSRAKDLGITGNKSGSTLLGTMDLINGLNGKVENMSKEGRYYYEYFKEAGELDPILVEHTIHRKIIGTTGMNPIQKAIAESVNTTFKGAELLSNVIGKVSIEKPEAWTRGTFAMTMAHFYRSAGYSMKESAIQAAKDTSHLFVDYSSQERAMIFQRMGETGKFASTVSTFKLNNLNQWVTFSNRKMYGALAALALTSWFATGLSGLPLMDEAEFATTWTKSKGIELPILGSDTPREYMLKYFPDAVSFGPLSQALVPFGGPSMALHRKFAQDNVIPDDLPSFIYPLLSFYTNKIKKGADWIGSGEFSGQEGKAFLREVVPGNLKYLVDAKALTNEQGLTLDTNTMHEENPTYVERSKGDRILGVLMGISSQDEWKSKQIKQLDKISEQAWKESTKSKVKSTISAFDNGNKDKFVTLYRQAVQYSPESAKEITNYIKGHAVSRNITIDQALEMKFAKRASTVHGAKLLQGFRKMQENR